MKQVTVGSVVKIYQQPMSRENCEGKAKIIRIYDPSRADGFLYCKVRFVDEPETAYDRVIWTKEPVCPAHPG